MNVVEAWLRLAAVRVAERRAWLTDLDAAIGDGDHGINVDRGLAAVIARLDRHGDLASPPVEGLTPAELLLVAGRTITGTVGGASGALYGRALTRAGTSLAGRPGAVVDVAAAIAAAVEAVAALGRSRPGQKTMLDALVPASDAFAAAAAAGDDLAGAAAQAADAAEAGARTTVPMQATKGRASYLGERSRGHMDPGAASSALLLRALADAAAR